MSGRPLTYPFSAVIGEGTAKRALQCLLADDSLNGVLIKGPSGTAKSVLARSLSELTERSIIDLPASASDEDIFGSIDFETAIKDGKARLKGGILQRADGNILCIDNINLMDPRTLNAVTECICTRLVRIERDGISAEYGCNTTVVATMDPAERELPDSIADRFDICILVLPDEDTARRASIVEQDLLFHGNPQAFCSSFATDDASVRDRIERARNMIPSIKITRRDVNDIVVICDRVNAIGHRGDIACARTARALAALDGTGYIRAEDIKEASLMCLLHRRGHADTSEEKADAYPGETTGDDPDDAGSDTVGQDDIPAEVPAEEEADIATATIDQEETGLPDDQAVDGETDQEDGPDIQDIEVITSMLEEVQTDLSDLDRIESIRLSRIVGKIPRSAHSSRNGRACGYRTPEGRTADPALGATIRTAAPYQKSRKSNGLSITIERSDIRENIRKKASRCSFMFALDVSGSLKNTGRLDEAIQAVRAMLEDGYVRRDRVGLLTFGQLKVNLAVPFTRNVESVFEAIEKTETGGSTPLGQALLALDKYMNNYVRKNPDGQCYIIMITDGESDTPIVPGFEPNAEVRRICATVKIPDTEWIIIDNGPLSRRANYALDLADYLGGRYIDIRDVIDE